jgi:D-alanine transaminase
MQVIGRSNLKVEERPFTVAEAKRAREAFITGAGALVLPVIAIDGEPIGPGKAGDVAMHLRREYIATAKGERD